MKIDTRQISSEGLTLIEEFDPKALDLDTELIKFLKPVRAEAVITKSYGAICVFLTLGSVVSISCSRCLQEKEEIFTKSIELDYAVDKLEPVIELDSDIREEVILGYSINPLCSADCKGLCPKCGVNLNEGGCNCGST